MGKLLSRVPEWAEALAEDRPKPHPDPAPKFSLEALKENPRLQAALANCTAYTPSKWLVEQELSRRSSNASRESGDCLSSWKSDDGIEEKVYVDVYDAAARERLSGLALSGGGIRSATFSLGILQALAAEGLLCRFDYISSVSGGGYIHQWLAAWIRRERDGIASVQKKMLPLPKQGSLARAPEQINWLRRYSSYLTPSRGLFTADTWTMIAIWFRNTFLNQIVLFSFFFVCLGLARAMTHPFFLSSLSACGMKWLGVVAVLWSLFGIVIFGVAIHSQTEKPRDGGKPPFGAVGDAIVVLCIVLPGLFFAVLLALAMSVSNDRVLRDLYSWQYLLIGGWGACLLALLITQTFAGRAPATSWENHPKAWTKRVAGVLFTFSAFLCMLVPLGTVSLICYNNGHHLIAQTVADHINRHLPQNAPCPKGFEQSRLAAKAGCAVCPPQKTECTAVHAPSAQNPISPRTLLAIFLPLFFFAVQFLCVRLQLGIIGRGYEDSRREWLARLGGWAAILGFLWFGLGAIARIGPSIFYALFDSSLERALFSGLVAVATHGITLYAGSSSKTSGAPDPRKFFGYSLLDLVGLIGAPIAILTLLVIASGLVELILNHVQVLVSHFVVDKFPGYFPNLLRPRSSPGCILFYFLVLSAAILGLFGWRVDINEFSLHPFYRNSLARCYLGASNGRRVPDPFTGFDDHEEASGRSGMTLAELLPKRFGGMTCNRRQAYDGPMPIFCSTINLTSGADLAYQDRKGASFAFTPLLSGYHVNWTVERGTKGATTYNGFVPTSEYAYRPQSCELRDAAREAQCCGERLGILPAISGATQCCEKRTGILLASAAAISGAALSPNQGYNSQPALAFLMTLFNVRLGWWIANTRKPTIWPSKEFRPSPRFGLLKLISELCGSSDDTTNYVCLSDGGQFDNMGLYELIRRRASLIVVCDGEEDDRTTFEGMGLAIAKARIDFGVDIEFEKTEIDKLIPNKETGRSEAHFIVGTIQYPPPPESQLTRRAFTGTILYLKTAFVGDEPLDLRHYKREHPDFPQEGTLNQWFTEAQFESYRTLGQITGQQAVMRLRRLFA